VLLLNSTVQTSFFQTTLCDLSERYIVQVSPS